MNYKVNFDYEFQLFDSNYHPQKYLKYNKQWEFLYWLAGETAPLSSCRQYSKAYLNKIEKLTGHKIQLIDSNDFTYWNGKINEEMKFLNSRLNSTQFAIDNHFAHEHTRINEMLTGVDDYIIKYEGGLSGSSFSKNLKDPINDFVFDPLLNRVFDFSTLFIEGKKYHYQCLVDDKFQFKGCRVLKSNMYSSQMLKELYPGYHFEIEDKLDFTFKHFDCGGIWSIDSFLYEEEGEIKLYLLSEINYRKTMGYCFVKFLENQKTGFNRAEFIIGNQGGLSLSPEDAFFNLALHYF